MTEQIKIPYDKDVYLAIVKTKKFLEYNDLECLSHKKQSELEKISDRQIGEELIFTSEYIFDTNDLDKILRIHAPTDATAYFDSCKDNILTVRFYKI